MAYQTDKKKKKNEKEELDKWNRPAVSSETNSVKEAESEQKIREWTARALLWKKKKKKKWAEKKKKKKTYFRSVKQGEDWKGFLDSC